jgi:hypothetical protein
MTFYPGRRVSFNFRFAAPRRFIFMSSKLKLRKQALVALHDGARLLIDHLTKDILSPEEVRKIIKNPSKNEIFSFNITGLDVHIYTTAKDGKSWPESADIAAHIDLYKKKPEVMILDVDYTHKY